MYMYMYLCVFEFEVLSPMRSGYMCFLGAATRLYLRGSMAKTRAGPRWRVRVLMWLFGPQLRNYPWKQCSHTGSNRGPLGY